MSHISEENFLEIIEVPPELRGPSDEEILKMSEKILPKISGKRKKGERRPSKRARQAMKQEKQLQEAQNLALELFSKSVPEDSAFRYENRNNSYSRDFNSLSTERQNLIRNAFNPQNENYSTFATAHGETNKEKVAQQTKAPLPSPMPTSGRVLKASFGAKINEKPKAVIVSAAELAKQRAEERAKKIRDALMAKKLGTTAVSSQAATGDEIQPVKRPRGRPRKNPV